MLPPAALPARLELAPQSFEVAAQALEVACKIIRVVGPPLGHGGRDRIGLCDSQLRVEPGREGKPGVGVVAVGAMFVDHGVLDVDQLILETACRVDHARQRWLGEANAPGLFRPLPLVQAPGVS